MLSCANAAADRDSRTRPNKNVRTNEIIRIVFPLARESFAPRASFYCCGFRGLKGHDFRTKHTGSSVSLANLSRRNSRTSEMSKSEQNGSLRGWVQILWEWSSGPRVRGGGGLSEKNGGPRKVRPEGVPI